MNVDLWIWIRPPALFRLLGDDARLRLLRVLARERLNVTELTGVLGLAQSGVSRHLGLLKEAGLVQEHATAASPTTGWRRPPDAARGKPLSGAARRASSRLPPATRPSGRRSAAARGAAAAEGELRGARRPRHARRAAARARPQLGGLVARPGTLLPPLEVADLGCGEGYLTVEAARWASRVVGVDRSAAVLAPARAPGRAASCRATSSGSAASSSAADRRRQRGRRAALAGAAPRARARPPPSPRRPRSRCRAERVLVLDLRAHDEDWVRTRLGDRARIRRRRAERLLTGAGLSRRPGRRRRAPGGRPVHRAGCGSGRQGRARRAPRRRGAARTSPGAEDNR